ncbi:MAG: RNA-guided endonuclease InsQ/TnpB family protein [Spirulina sp.]
MKYQVVKVRIYPSKEQKHALAKMFGCARWWWNFALAESQRVYQETGKGLTKTKLNAYLPKLKKQEETEWLSKCDSQVLQSVTLNLSKAFDNFFAKRAKYPRFKSKKGRQSIQFPQRVKIVGDCLKIPKGIDNVRAKFHREIPEGILKTVTISLTPSGKYHASLLFESEGENPTSTTEGRVAGIDLGIKDFAIVNDGEKTAKYANPKHIAKHEKNLKRKQQKLSRKTKGSKSRDKARKLVARVYERVSNSRQDFLHKLSRKLVDENQVIVVENLNVKGMVRNHCLAKAISDVGWGTFVNFLDYKLTKEGKVLVEIDHWFPSSKICSECGHEMKEMPLEVREWTCPKCSTTHDRDENAAKNIRAEGIRQLRCDPAEVCLGQHSLGEETSPGSDRSSAKERAPREQALGISASAEGGGVRLDTDFVGIEQSPVISEAPTIPLCG